MTLLEYIARAREALRREKAAAWWWWESYPAHTVGVGLLCIVTVFGSIYVFTEYSNIKDLELELSGQSKHFEEKLERKNRLLAAALSHLEDNPVLKSPGNNLSLSGPIVNMKWQYSSKATNAGQSTENTTASQHSVRHSILEMRNAKNPLQTRKILVTGDSAWFPISFKDGLEKPDTYSGTYLWRVIPAEIDSSGKAHAEGNWGPFFAFSVYRSAYDRVNKTKKMMIGAYSVEQFDLNLLPKKASCLKGPVGLSERDSEELCTFLNSFSKLNSDVTPVVKLYADIDHELIPSLKAGELDIAFGDISKSEYRENEGLLFLEYKQSAATLVTKNVADVSAERIDGKDPICTFPGTVYQKVARAIMDEERDKKKKSYTFLECQNIYDAIDKLNRKEISWVFIDRQTYTDINNANPFSFTLHENTNSRLLRRVNDQLGGYAYAMTDQKLCKAMSKVIQAPKTPKKSPCEYKKRVS